MKKLFSKWKKTSDGRKKAIDLLEEWKKVIIENARSKQMNVAIETMEEWLGHPKKALFINWKDNSIAYGRTMLICAIDYGRLDIAKSLLKHGANINITDKDRNTALIRASSNGHPEIVKILLEKGADFAAANKNGNTALIYASRWGYPDVVELLLNKGAECETANKNGDTALSVAFEKERIKIMGLLLDKTADPNVCNSKGQTFLHRACLLNMKAIAQQVLKLGTDKDRIDENGHTALFYAAEKGFVDIVEWLTKENGADANKTDERRLVRRANNWGVVYSYYMVEDGRTPLFIAAQNGHHNVVSILLQHGADPYLCNHESKIPVDVSKVHGPIQQLFRIQDFFDQREQGHAWKRKYTTCVDNHYFSECKKMSVPPLEDIIHDIVKYPHYADKFMELYHKNREIVNWLDKDGRTVRQVACKECREVTLFLSQYDLDDKPIYESPTCKIYNALDYGGPDEPDLAEPRKVAMKLFSKREHFENEMRARRKGDGSSRFSSKFVIPHLAAYQADKDEAYAEACRNWKGGLGSFCVVLERGERSLLTAMNAENLSAEDKDLQRREILLTLCKIFAYLHESGYVHGDIKPHNVVRHMGESVTWKAIDFDACTKIGDVVGLKLTTGSAPPEMLTQIAVQSEKDTGEDSMVDSKVILRQPQGDLVDETELVPADPSFDVWSFGILMYQLLTGRTFFHSDLQGNLDYYGLLELANLTQRRINEKIATVKDVNARVLLSRILRLDPKERPTMENIGQDYYFFPSESPQGRKAEFFRRQAFDDEFNKNETTSSEAETSESVQEMERFLSSKTEFSYFTLRDEDKDWSDKLLNSEVESFQFDKLGEMGEKPKLIDGDTIYENDFLHNLLSNRGPDYFMGFLVEYFELYKIMNDAHEVCQGIKVNLVSDVKDLKGIFTKLFVRGKGLNDCVRGTLFCNTIDQFKYVGRQLKERYGHNVYIKPPKKEAGAWPIPKLLIYGNRQFQGLCIAVEIQFSTVYMHLATHASNNHLVYEAIRESTGYLGDKDEAFQEFLRKLNEKYIDTEGFLRKHQSSQEGRFEILLERSDEKDNDGNRREESDKQHVAQATGFITSGRVRCGDQFLFQFMPSKDHMEKFSESSFVVNKSLTLLSSHSFWSNESYDLQGKTVDFVVSFKGRGVAIAGIGTVKCLHGATEDGGGGGARCSVHVGRPKFLVRKNGLHEFCQEKKLPNQERAKIRFQMMNDGELAVSFLHVPGGSNEKESTEEVLAIATVSMPRNQRYYYLYMRAPAGVHDVKFHEIQVSNDDSAELLKRQAASRSVGEETQYRAQDKRQKPAVDRTCWV